MKRVTVYREPGRYAGWPANEGIWSWDEGQEIVVEFNLGYMKLDVGESLHRIDRERPRITAQARSTDGGETWRVGDAPLPVGDAMKLPFPLHVNEPDFALKCRGSSMLLSYDRCRTWRGPYFLPGSEGLEVAARTDYGVVGKSDCVVFLTASKRNKKEGRPYCIRTQDDGRTWKFVSWIGPEPEGFSIMPSNVRLDDGRFLVAIRRHEESGNFIELYESGDECATWRHIGTPVPDAGERSGNPPAMIRLRDGRLALTYGYRRAPFGIRARLSEDEGRTWSEDTVLRDDAGDADLGYPRTVQRRDGKIVTVYYYDDDPFGERYIGGTIWEAETLLRR